MIAFVGSVFSPYYASARRRGPADPEQHCAINVALYGPDRDRWAMTERGRRHMSRSADRFSVGPSSVSFEDGCYVVRVDEVTVPFPARLKGEIRLRPHVRFGEHWYLDAAERHCWQPVAPNAAIEVDFERPDLHWRGSGYLDSNWGSEPLEAGFVRWHWSRAPVESGAIMSYDADRRDGSELRLGLHYTDAGEVHPIDLPPLRKAATTGWRVGRAVRSERAASVRHTAEDTPFYARTMFDVELAGAPVRMMHESLDLDRFASRWVQTLLPFRMPRRR